MGIFEEQSDPAKVLGQTFRNTEIIEFRWHRLALPPFLKTVYSPS
jgi:hypothetical protein